MADNIFLPTELIERALEFAASIDTPTALAVCLTNKLGRRAAQRTLYHTLDISGVYNDNLIDVRLRRLSLLARTLLHNPVLAKHVRHIKAYFDDLEGVTYKAPPQIDYRAFERRVNDLPISDGQKRSVKHWLEVRYREGDLIVRQRDVDQDDEDEDQDEDDDTYDFGPEPFFGPECFLSVLTLACSNLEAIDISGCPHFMDPIAELHDALNRNSLQALRHSGLTARQLEDDIPDDQVLTRPDGLAKVKAVQFSSNHQYEAWPVTAVEIALNWPSIEVMTIESLSEAGFGGREPSTYSSTLKSLNLTNAYLIDVSELEPLLQACPQLRSFTLSWSEHVKVYREVDWRELGRALAESNSLLESICLDIAPYAHFRDITPNAQVNNKGIGGALTGLKHLRKLSAPYIALFGVFDDPQERDHDWTLPEIVPNSLEEIEVFSEGVELYETDRALVKAPGTSRLHDITVWNCTRNKWISKSRGEGQFM